MMVVMVIMKMMVMVFQVRQEKTLHPSLCCLLPFNWTGDLPFFVLILDGVNWNGAYTFLCPLTIPLSLWLTSIFFFIQIHASPFFQVGALVKLREAGAVPDLLASWTMVIILIILIIIILFITIFIILINITTIYHQYHQVVLIFIFMFVVGIAIVGFPWVLMGELEQKKCYLFAFFFQPSGLHQNWRALSLGLWCPSSLPASSLR